GLRLADQLAHLAREGLADPDRDAGLFLEQREEVRALEAEHLGGAARGDRGAAGLSVEERQLADDVGGALAGHEAALARDLQLARQDEVHAVAELALADQHGARGMALGPEGARHLAQLARRQAREEIETAQVEDGLEPARHDTLLQGLR